MTGLFKIFKRNKGGQAASAPSTDNKAPIAVNFGSDSSLLASSSKRPLIFAIMLNIALTILGYRYFTIKVQPEVSQAPITAIAKPITIKSDDNASLREQLTKARNLYANRKIDESLAIYEKLVTKTPKDAEMLNDMGVLYLKKQKLIEGESAFKRSLEANPQCAVCLNNLGYLKTLQGENEEAEAYLKKAIELDHDYLDPYFNLGVLYEKNGDIGRSANAYGIFFSRSKDQSTAFNLQLKQHIFSILEK